MTRCGWRPRRDLPAVAGRSEGDTSGTCGETEEGKVNADQEAGLSGAAAGAVSAGCLTATSPCTLRNTSSWKDEREPPGFGDAFGAYLEGIKIVPAVPMGKRR